MSRTLAALLLTAAAIAPAPAFAQAVTEAVDPARRALGYELAKLLNGEERTLALVERVFDEQMPKGMMADANVAALEKAYPGVVKAMIDAMKPIIIRYLKAQLPSLWDTLALFFASNMTEDELRATIAFYRSPAGMRIMEVMDQEIDFTPVMSDMARSGNYEVTARGISSAVATGADKLETMMTPEQYSQAMRFMRTPAGRKVAMLTPRMLRLVTEWSNEPSPPELDAELDAAMTKTLKLYTGMKIEP